MISDEEVKQLFSNGHGLLAKQTALGSLLTQFYRGKLSENWEGQRLGACTRHLAIFNYFNIIPKYCFDCYKVTITPRTVIELFKLMILFDKVVFPNDNTRKCIVEIRPNIAGTYKGLVYCRSIEEAEEIILMIQPILSDEISAKIPIALQRGCSEYAISYPEYAQITKGVEPTEYKNEWQKYEDLADKNAIINKGVNARDTHNSPNYELDDYNVMFAWLRYASTIGDNSYLKISDRTLPPLQDLSRPTSFQQVSDKE